MAGSQPPSSTPSGRPTKRRSRGELARTVVWVLLAVLITLFAVLNVKSVEVNWIFGSSEAPLIIVIVISLLVGIVLTYMAQRSARRRRRGSDSTSGR